MKGQKRMAASQAIKARRKGVLIENEVDWIGN